LKIVVYCHGDSAHGGENSRYVSTDAVLLER
jgi:hypothetical protein